jgi:hypothetical protein
MQTEATFTSDQQYIHITQTRFRYWHFPEGWRVLPKDAEDRTPDQDVVLNDERCFKILVDYFSQWRWKSAGAGYDGKA